MKMYCIKCGAQLDDDAKFCIKCGAQVNVTADDLSVPESEVNEPMKFTENYNLQEVQQTNGQGCGFSLMLKTGVMKQEASVFVVTSQEIIVVLVGNQRYQQIQKEKSAETEGGFLKKSLAMNTAFRDYAVNLAEKPISEIVSMFPNSERVAINSVKSLRISSLEDSDGVSNGEYAVELHTDAKKYKGTLDRTVNQRTLSKDLKELLGRKFKRFSI